MLKKIPLQSAQPREYLKGDYLSSMFLEDEVRIIILNLKNRRPGWDDLKPDIIKHVCQHITLPVTHIVNLSLENGIVPWKLKKQSLSQFVKVVISKCSKTTVLPVFSKILERLMYNRVIKFINKQDILYTYQFGFKRNTQHKCLLQLLSIQLWKL